MLSAYRTLKEGSMAKKAAKAGAKKKTAKTAKKR